MQYLDAISKMTERSVCIQGKPLNITLIQAQAPNSNTEKAEVEQFYEELQDLLELFNFSFFSVTGWGTGLDLCDIEWFSL